MGMADPVFVLKAILLALGNWALESQLAGCDSEAEIRIHVVC